MGNRRQKRVKAVLPVRLWGNDAEGKPFVCMAHTLDVSRSGARLGGLTQLPKVGDTVGLQYRNAKLQYRVAWATAAQDKREALIGVECLHADKDLWGLRLPLGEHDEYEARQAPARRYEVRDDERRRHLRFPVAGSALVSAVRGATGEPAELRDISMEGCFVVTQKPAPVDTRLQILLKIQDVDIVAMAAVRVCYAGTGMGMQFMEMSPADARRLRELVGRLTAEMSTASGA
jgi:hypothetical protein